MNRIAVLVLASGALLSSAHANTILFNSLGDSADGNRAIFPTTQYQSFSVGASAVTLVDVQVDVFGDNTDGDSFSVDVYNSNAGPVPGSLLQNVGTLSDSSLPSEGTEVLDFSSLSISLSASTRYWIGISTSNGSGTNWVIAPPGSGSDVGVSGEFNTQSGAVGSDSSQVFMMQLSTGPTGGVPEPATFLLCGAGLLAIGLLRRRQQEN